MAEISSAEHIQQHDGQRVTAVGVYTVIDMGRFRSTAIMPDGTEIVSSKLARVVFSDGAYVQLGPRPEEELAECTRHPVRVTGTLQASPPRQPADVAQFDPVPTVVDIEEVVRS